jgi:hypothetical protein
MNLDRWLTSRRLRAHGLLLALTIWAFYIWTIATPTLRDRNWNLKGTDFLHFYTLGSLAIEHHGGELYNMDAQAAMAAQRIPNAGASATCRCILHRFRLCLRRWHISLTAGHSLCGGCARR